MKRPKSRIQKRVERLQRKARYGPSWDQIRESVYKRDGYKCRACGASKPKVKKLNAHHILLLRVSQTNDTRNLVTLCDRCHVTIEQKALKLLKSGGHRFEVIRMTHRWLLEMNQKYKDGELLVEEI